MKIVEVFITDVTEKSEATKSMVEIMQTQFSDY